VESRPNSGRTETRESQAETSHELCASMSAAPTGPAPQVFSMALEMVENAVSFADRAETGHGVDLHVVEPQVW